jgi:hypothetical protein
MDAPSKLSLQAPLLDACSDRIATPCASADLVRAIAQIEQCNRGTYYVPSASYFLKNNYLNHL